MAQTYEEIQQRIAALQRKAEALKSKEVEGVVSRIKVAIAHYGLTAEQLGFGEASAARADVSRSAKPSKAGPRFTDRNGNVWSGRGPRPRWLVRALESGKSLEDLMLRSSDSHPGEVSRSANSKKKRKMKRRPSSVIYRDDAGNSWTGRGPQPRWLKDALASGKSLESMRTSVLAG